MAHLAFHALAPQPPLVKRGIIDKDVAAPLGLDTVHGGVGPAQQLVRVNRLVAIAGNADRGANIDLVPVNQMRRGQRCLHQTRQIACALGGAGRLHQNGKFIAPHARHHGRIAHNAGHLKAGLADQRIAQFMPKIIVDGFKAIQIDKDDGHRVGIGRVLRVQIFQPGNQRAAVGQAAQRIGKSDAAVLLAQHLGFGLTDVQVALGMDKLGKRLVVAVENGDHAKANQPKVERLHPHAVVVDKQKIADKRHQTDGGHAKRGRAQRHQAKNAADLCDGQKKDEMPPLIGVAMGIEHENPDDEGARHERRQHAGAANIGQNLRIGKFGRALPAPPLRAQQPQQAQRRGHGLGQHRLINPGRRHGNRRRAARQNVIQHRDLFDEGVELRAQQVAIIHAQPIAIKYRCNLSPNRLHPRFYPALTTGAGMAGRSKFHVKAQGSTSAASAVAPKCR